MREEIEKRIEELKSQAEYPYVDSSVRAEARKKLEYIEEFYQAMYEW